jgi:hypothetical protein
MSAKIVIVTCDNGINTTSIFITRIISTLVIIITCNWSIYASQRVIAGIIGAFIVIITCYRGRNDSINRIAGRNRAFLASVRNRSVNASKDRVARVSCADIFIITVNSCIPTSSLRIAAPIETVSKNI